MPEADSHSTPQARSRRRSGLWLALGILALVLAVLSGAELTSRSSGSGPAGLAANPDLDPGTALAGPAPDFTLTDQFGRRVSLHAFRGKVVILAFNDAQCTTICPLTTTAMVDAQRMLGAAGGQVQLLGIDANPTATSIADVRAYSEVHGMVHQWHFLTGSLDALKRVWKAYKIDVAIEQGQIDHTPALFLIDARGRLARLYLTQQSYAAVGQFGQLLAQDVAELLPGHPPVQARLSYNHSGGISPGSSIIVPRSGGGTIALGRNGAPRLYLFFASWDQQVMNLAGQLQALNRFATGAGLPRLTAVDEASVEPSPSALQSFLAGLHRPLAYPVAIDRTGRVADGYGVQDEPWLVLTDGAGRILWYYDVSTSGWLSFPALRHQVQAALARGAEQPATAAAVRQELAGSPPPLAALHAQGGRLLSGESQLAARIAALRGFPVVLNVWGSWCGPCQAEFGLFASAAARDGRRVAFLGADVNDDAGDAQAFLDRHPVSYPSYGMASSALTAILPQGLLGTPTTVFFDRSGKITHVHTGQYDAQGVLDGDVSAYALGS